ncbi:Retrovirus-related Pol polyprotein from transposon RE2 [Vitis vinifera]|uniref:Retrovirus-related Pol polyprotein from transposon RE2 n=1 Tax=Vitis vinifera TaxID=29760 RepID=A0A438DUZ2_VITVI|nr:Retrovirus-related Pol polyprotein from transposon RE2 [Vitis vinifera]
MTPCFKSQENHRQFSTHGKDYTKAVYSIPANRSSDRVSLRSPHSLPEPPRTTSSPSDLYHAGNLSGEFFRRPLFRAPTTYSEPPEADLHASGNPTGNRSLTRPHAPIFPVGLSPTRRARDGAWLTFRPRPTPLQARPAPSWPSSPPAVLPEPCISTFFPVFGFLAIPTTSDRASSPSPSLGCCFSSSPGLSSIQIREYDHQKSDLTSVLSGSPLITSEKLVGSENYLSWSASVELWFMGQGYEDHLVTQEADIPEAKGLYTNDIQRLYKMASAIVHLSQQDLNLSTYIGQIASLKEQFLTVMPLTPDVGAQQTQLDKFFMVLTLIGLRPDLEPIRDQILGSSSVPSLDDVFARLLRLSSTQTLPSDSASDSSVLVSQTTSRGGRSGTRGRGQRPHCTYCNKLGHTRDRCYQLHGRPPRTAHMAQSSDSPLPQPPSSSASQTSQASIASVAQPGNASACLTHTSSLGPWILDSGAYDHLSGNKDLFSSITTTSDLPTVTLANGSQTVAKAKITSTLNCSITFSDKFVTLQDRSTGKTIGIGRESQGLYHLTSDSSPAVCISTDAPLLIHNRLAHPSLSKFQKMVPRFSTLSSLPCESCQLEKHTRVSFPKRLNNRAKSPFELVHTDVWGPCRTAFTLGFQYFVTFIDDYSRSQFTSFMSHHGILHQSSCAHTPQQNGVAERKNRHLVETARTLLLHSHIPHSLLFPDQPLYFLPPRVFGCTCFVHILTPGQDKLSAKAMKCLFLGYSRLQKVVIPLRLIGTLSPLMSPSLRTHHSFPPLLSLFPFLKSCPFPLSPHLKLCPLDHFRFIIVARVSLLLSLFLRHLPDSLPIPSASPAPALPSPNDLPIAVRKGTRSTRNPHLIYNFLSYHRLSSPYSAFVSAISSVSLPKSTHEALFPSRLATGNVKVGPDGQVDRLKARLVAKGYTQVYGSDYGDTFSPVAKIACVRLLLSMAAMCSWPLYQLDIKNAFLHGGSCQGSFIWSNLLVLLLGESGLVCRLCRSLYGLKQSPRAWFSRFSSVVQEFGMLRSTADHSVFYHHNSLGQCIYLVVYVDDIVITGSDQDDSSIQFWCGPFSKEYALDILEETGMLDCKSVDTPMDPNVKLVPGQGEPLGDPGRYRRLSPCDSHWDAVIRILRYIKSTPGQGVLYENRGHTQVVGYTDADWAGSPTDRRSLQGTVFLLEELRFGKDEQMKLICDNQAALHIASNPVFHERTKHIEVDCHFIREKIASGCVATSFVNSNDQLADIFTKSLRGPRIKYICKQAWCI